MKPVFGERTGREVIALAGVFVLSLATALSAGAIEGNLYRDAVSSPRGVVVSISPQASQAGIEVLQAGGNAIDAAVATVFAVGVARPDMCGIGGGGFLVYGGADGTTAALDFREAAPLAPFTGSDLEGDGMHQDDPLGLGGHSGHRTIGVPGLVSGMAAALEKYGTISLSAAIGPAERLAREGVTVSFGLASDAFLYSERLNYYEETRRVYLGADGQALTWGSTLKQPDYADSLQRIQQYGPSGFYDAGSETVTNIVADSEAAEANAKTNPVLLAAWDANPARDFTPSADKGFLKATDFSSYTAKWRKPLQGSYRGYQIIAMPPPTSGGIATLEILNLLEGFPLGTDEVVEGWAGGWRQSSANHLHALVEAQKIAFADRAAYVADPDFVSVPTRQLTSKGYAQRRRREIKGGQAKTYPPGSVNATHTVHTTHISVIDASGNAVAVTCSMGDAFGSGVVAPGTGFLLNNHNADFDLDKDTKSVNDPEAGKRPRSSISPTIVVSNGRPVLVTGAGGGPSIILGVVQNIVNVIDFGRDIAQAIDDERVDEGDVRVFDCQQGQMMVEDARIADEVQDELRDRGHILCIETDKDGGDGYWFVPIVQSAGIDLGGNRLAVSDPRSCSSTVCIQAGASEDEDGALAVP